MKFICYSLFGWGMPLMMAILTALFDLFPNWGSVRPQMGHSSCFLSIRGARFFFYMPILILLCFNTLMYLVTVYSLWKTKKASKKAGLNRVNTASRGRNFATSMTPPREVLCFLAYFSREVPFTLRYGNESTHLTNIAFVYSPWRFVAGQITTW